MGRNRGKDFVQSFARVLGARFKSAEREGGVGKDQSEKRSFENQGAGLETERSTKKFYDTKITYSMKEG